MHPNTYILAKSSARCPLLLGHMMNGQLYLTLNTIAGHFEDAAGVHWEGEACRQPGGEADAALRGSPQARAVEKPGLLPHPGLPQAHVPDHFAHALLWRLAVSAPAPFCACRVLQPWGKLHRRGEGNFCTIIVSACGRSGLVHDGLGE